MKKIIAKDLLDIKAVFLRPNEPFTWASGIKSPIYCDNRLTLSDVKVRNDVENALAQLIQTNYPECEQVIGTSTAGIPHGSIVAHLLGLSCHFLTIHRDARIGKASVQTTADERNPPMPQIRQVCHHFSDALEGIRRDVDGGHALD